MPEQDPSKAGQDVVADTAAESTDPAIEPMSGESAEAATTPSATTRRFMSGLIPKLAIAVAIVAVLIASALWWQYRQFYVELDSYDAFLLETLEDTRASLRRLADEVATVRSELGARDAQIEDLGSDLEVLPAELRVLERRLDALQGGQIDARDNWLREQAEYYLVLANNELNLAGRVGNAIAALELADDVVRDLGDPALANVRVALAAELQALRAVPVPDLERHAADLGSLMVRAADLPMRAASPTNFGAPEDSLDDVEPGLGRLLARTRGAVTSIVRIERQEEPVGVVLTESERELVRRQLALELQLARTAVLERRQGAFRASLIGADTILNQDFDRNAQSIIEARRLLGAMMSVELQPELPEIGDSLSLFRATPGAE